MYKASRYPAPYHTTHHNASLWKLACSGWIKLLMRPAISLLTMYERGWLITLQNDCHDTPLSKFVSGLEG